MGKIKKCKGTESISRDLIFDNELSDRARFVYCYMMAKPDNWDFYVSSMAKDLGYSEDTLHKYINELINRGWLEKGEQARDKDNKWGAVSYTIYEVRRQKKAVTEIFRDGEISPQKEIDLKEIREDKKENKKDKSFLSKNEDKAYFDVLLSLGIDNDVAMEFMKLRKNKKATNSPRSSDLAKRAITEVSEKLRITPTNVIEICLARGWYGCQTSYFSNIKLSDFGITTASGIPQAQANRYEMIDEQGNRYYLQGYGKHKVIIPSDAPPRPSETMFWSNFTKSWYQP